MSEEQERTFEQQDEFRPEGSGCSPVLKILGIGCLVFIAVGIGCAIYAAANFKKLAATAAGGVAKHVIRDSGMPGDQQKEFNRHIDRLIGAYKNGEITEEELGVIMEELSASPLIPMTMVSLADSKYVKPSGLSQEEKIAGTRNLQRFGRGVLEKKIPESDIQEVFDLVTVKNEEGKTEPKEHLTDEEVRNLLSTVKDKADTAEIPDENYEINPAREFGKVIDKALGEEGTRDSNQPDSAKALRRDGE